MIALEAIGADDWQVWRELRLQALAEAPYAFGTRLAEWQGQFDAESRWRARLTDVPFNVVAYLDGASVGIVSATAPDTDATVALISMWVAPLARGCGVGDALVQAVLRWSFEQKARRVALDVFENNEHAIALYRRHGFAFANGAAAAPGERAMERRLG